MDLRWVPMPLETPALLSFPKTSSQNFPQRLKLYFALGKPGIAFSVVVTAFVGYAAGLASDSRFAFSASTLLHALFGTFLVSMGAGTLNMLLESESDALMDRTKSRPIPSGKIPAHEVFFLGCLLASFGVAHLAGTVNLRASFIAGVSLVLYLVFYTPMKKTSAASTVVGAVSGALPPLIGWSASGANFGLDTWSLFAILFLWQFPHFLALFWLYRADYAKAGIKTLISDDESGQRTARAAFALSLLLSGVSMVPYLLGVGRPIYLMIAFLLNCFLIFSVYRFARQPDERQARLYFLSTVIYLPVLFLALALRV